MREGVGFVLEDRKKQGLVLQMCNRENATLPTLERFARAGLVNDTAEVTAVSHSFGRVQLSASRDAITSSLSGGNQQKVVLSKWLTAESDILILDEPTRGVDVGAKSELHAWIDERAAQGAAVLLISSELPELLGLSTRILVLRDGRLCGDLISVSANTPVRQFRRIIDARRSGRVASMLLMMSRMMSSAASGAFADGRTGMPKASTYFL